MKKVERVGTRRVITESVPHEDKMYVRQDSHQFEKHLASQNAALRSIGQSGKGKVRLQFQMSEQDLEQLQEQYPVLRFGTNEQKRRAWERVAKERPELVAIDFQRRVFVPPNPGKLM